MYYSEVLLSETILFKFLFLPYLEIFGWCVRLPQKSGQMDIEKCGDVPEVEQTDVP